MILYHGSTVEIALPQIILSERCKDFGFGFYTTTIREQAEKWAIRKAKIAKLLDKKKAAILNICDFDEEKAKNCLNIKDFPKKTTEEWLDFVLKK